MVCWVFLTCTALVGRVPFNPGDGRRAGPGEKRPIGAATGQSTSVPAVTVCCGAAGGSYPACCLCLALLTNGMRVCQALELERVESPDLLPSKCDLSCRSSSSSRSWLIAALSTPCAVLWFSPCEGGAVVDNPCSCASEEDFLVFV